MPTEFLLDLLDAFDACNTPTVDVYEYVDGVGFTLAMSNCTFENIIGYVYMYASDRTYVLMPH